MDIESFDESDTNSEFYFESDHLALKGNKDYTALLKTIVTLETQRARALQDLDQLLVLRTKAMNNPILFVAQLQNNDLQQLSNPQKIADIPYVDWSKYTIIDTNTRIRPHTRHGNFITQVQTKLESDDKKIMVRGRAFDESKPETFNQLWTNEEQRRLEQLLIEYPPENVEMRRWTKIANALGNRTPKQVSSRVQKYFIKLLRAGLPIPGRGPKFKLDIKKSLHYRHQRNNYTLFKKSTFFPHQDLFTKIDSKEKTSNHCTCRKDLLKKWNGEWPANPCSNCAGQSSTDYKQSVQNCEMVECNSGQKNYDADYYFQTVSDSSYNYLDTNFLPS